jgi:AcrR family transcriptional regulator
MPKSRREERREGTIQEIKEWAWKQMSENGPASLSLREISRQMRMSSAAIYRYFANREALLNALSLDAYNAHAAALEAAIKESPAGNPLEHLWTLALAYRQWALEHPVQYALIYGSPIPGFQPDWAMLVPAAGRGLQALFTVMQAAWKAGEIRSTAGTQAPPLAVYQHLTGLIAERAYPVSSQALYLSINAWARVHGLVSLEMLGQLGILVGDPAQLFRQEIQSFLASLHG